MSLLVSMINKHALQMYLSYSLIVKAMTNVKTLLTYETYNAHGVNHTNIGVFTFFFEIMYCNVT